MNRIEFFKHLYRNCEEGSIEIRTLPSKKVSFFDSSESGLSELDRYCDTVSDNCYFGVATRDGKGGKKENIVEIPAVWVDIDFKETPKEMAHDLLKKFPYSPSVGVFSGGGYHLYFVLREPAKQEDIAKVEDVNRRIASALRADLNACDASRILRVPCTKNCKYDPPRDVAVLKDYYHDYTLQDFLNILPEVAPKHAPQQSTCTNGDSWLSEAMKGVGEGQRDSTGAKIAGYWINKISARETRIILEAWNQNNKPPLSDTDIDKIIKSVSRYEPEKEKPRVDVSNIYTADRMLQAYREYIRTLKNNRFLTGITEIDKRIRGVSGGETMFVIARAGAYKTALLQNMLRNYINSSSWAAAFFSIEMPIPNIAERFLQVFDRANGHDIESYYSMNITEAIAALEFKFKQQLKNLYSVPTKVSLSDIAAYVKLIESEYRTKVGVIGIDYLGLLDHPGRDEYEIVSKVARELKATAKMLNIPIVALCQTSRKGGEGGTEITMDMARGSGAIEESADFLLGLWKENEKGFDATQVPPEPFDRTNLLCKILKNRKGPANSKWVLELEQECFSIGSNATEYVEPDQPRRRRKSRNADA